MRRALDGDANGIEALNRQAKFKFYRVVQGAKRQPTAVLRLDGNERENFRDYASGS